jgi:hypothetical protein
MQSGWRKRQIMEQKMKIPLKVPKAFPNAFWRDSDGMDLRDYFAAKAMQGLFASDAKDWNQEGEWDERAKTAYDMADAMMKAREA